MHIHALLTILLANLMSLAGATEYCSCVADTYKIHYTFKYINNGCAKLNNDWCSTNCAPFKKLCRYCQYTPAGQASQNSRKDLETLQRWCSDQSVTRLRGDTFYGKLSCVSYSQIKRCGECDGCRYYNNEFDAEPRRMQLPADADQDLLSLDDGDFQDEKPAVVVKPLNTSTEYQCLGITVNAAVAVAQAMADIFEPCGKTQVGVGRYEVDCNTARAAGCMEGELSGLAVKFDTLCDSYNGLAIDMSLSNHWFRRELGAKRSIVSSGRVVPWPYQDCGTLTSNYFSFVKSVRIWIEAVACLIHNTLDFIFSIFGIRDLGGSPTKIRFSCNWCNSTLS